jgi:hypothetical protein
MLTIGHHSSVVWRGCQPASRRVVFLGSDIGRDQEVGVKRVLVSLAVIVSVTVVTPLVGSASTISQVKLTSELLVNSQMPTGWTTSYTTSEGVGCVHDLLEPRGVIQTRTAQAYFLGTVDDLPRFDEKIATYSNTKSAYKKIIAHIDACHTLTGLFDGLEISGSVAPMSFSHYGNASEAYEMTVSDARGTLHYDYLIVRKGAVLAAFLEGSYPEVIPGEFQSLVSAGVKKLT